MNRGIGYIGEDMHVVVSPSREESTLATVIPWAVRAGITRLGVVVQAGSDDIWVPGFAETVRRIATPPELEVLVGIEVEIADAEGALDLPPGAECADFILAGDTYLPLSVGRVDAFALSERIEAGQISSLQVVREVISIYRATLNRHPGLVLARPFSMLRRLGIPEHWIGEDSLRALARTARETGSAFELNERWRCPGIETLKLLSEESVPILFGTEARSASGVGAYHYAVTALASVRRHGADCSETGGAVGSPEALRAAS